MGRLVWVVLGLLGWTVVAAPASWADPAAGLTESRGSLISPRRMPRASIDAERVPASVTVITAEDIRRSKASTVQQLLIPLAGVTFSDQQGFGLASDSTLNLRGIVNSSRTNALVLVDGVRQNRLTGDDVHWQAIPVDQIERIEVIRGGGGLIYGEGALSGVINILTKQDAARPVEAETGLEVGSFGWEQYALNVRGRTEPARYSVLYHRRLVDGERESSSSRNTTIRTHAGLDVAPGLSADVHVMHSEDTTGFPGLLTIAQSQQRSEQTNAFHGFNTSETDDVSLDLIAGPFEGLSSALSLFWNRRIQTSKDSINFNAFTVTPSRGLSLRTNHEWIGLNVEHLLVSGVELSQDKATTGDPGAGPDSETNRAGYGLFAEETLTFWNRVSLVGGLRYDRSRYTASLSFPDFTGTLLFEGWSPKVGLSVVLVPQRLRAFTVYSRPFKAPNVDDFSSRLGSFSRSNANLVPQQADTYEVGLQGTVVPGFSVDATAFYIRLAEEILYNNVAFTNQNFDTRRFGTELSLQARPAEGRWRGSIAYTFVDAEFSEGDFVGRTIPGTPAHTLSTSAGVSPLPGLWVDLSWRVVGRAVRFNDFDNILEHARSYGVVDLLVQYDVPRRWLGSRGPEATAYLRIDNLTSEEYSSYQSSNSVSLVTGAGEAPMPPIGFTGGVRVRF